MANVTCEHEAGDAIHAAAAETAGELERVQKDQGRLQDDLDCSCDDLAAAIKEFSDCWTAHEATSAKLCNASGKSATAVRLAKQSVSKQGRLCIEHMTSNATPRKYKKACRHRKRTTHISSEHASPCGRRHWFPGSSCTSSGQSHAQLNMWRPRS